MIKSLPNLYSFLSLPEREIIAITLNLRNYYSLKSKPKKKYGDFQRDDFGKIRYRELMVPIYILKSRQQKIAQLLNQIPLPEYMFGSVSGKNNIMNAQQHVNNKYFLTIDLKKFFPNINHRQVNAMFCNNGFSPSASRILTKLTTYQASLPQGAPSSPVISNLVFLKTGNKLCTLAKNNDITFTTFLDDLTFSSNYSFKNLIPQIIDIIKQDNFYPAYSKIHYRQDYCEITGLFVKGNVLELPYIMKKKIKSNFYIKPYQRLVQEYNHHNLSQFG
jgi:RNA-directed DNA polymerase